MQPLTREEKKQQELRIFLRYLETQKISYQQATVPVQDPPDIVLHTDAGLIYVEHTKMMCSRGKEDLIRSTSLKKLISEIEQEYVLKFPDAPMCASFHFKYQIDIAGKKGSQLKKVLVEKLHQLLPSHYDTVDIYQYEGLPEQLDYITLSRLPNPLETSLHLGEVRLYGALRKIEFTKPVQTKNKDLIKSGLLSQYTQAWLLLETGQEHGAFADLNVPMDWIDPTWAFKRIIIYDRFGGRRDPEFIEINM